MTVLTLFLILIAALAVWGLVSTVWQLPIDGFRQVPTRDPIDWTSAHPR